MREKRNIIVGTEDGSIAWEMGIEQGDVLISINGHEITDIFDLRFHQSNEYLELLVEKPDKEQWLLEIEKDQEEDLGLLFETGLMDKARSCGNKCIFCFIDQLPRGMRDTLYFKDDDSRLSFLQGNYVTLTNMSDADLSRIIYYRMSPINVSVHATDMELRIFMMKNPRAGRLMEQIKKIASAGLQMNFQIVLVKGVNDGVYLEKSIEELAEFLPYGQSLSVVPMGMTKYREGLFPARAFSREDCRRVIDIVEKAQKRCKSMYGTSFVFAADEIYITADWGIPDYEAYEDFVQLENGVGMLALMRHDLMEAIGEIGMGGGYTNGRLKYAIATGVAAYPFMKEMCGEITSAFGDISLEVHQIVNDFFGSDITVSGLLCGRDIIAQMKGKDLGMGLLIPANALRADTEVFLDDVTVTDMERELGARVIPCESDRFLRHIIERN